MLRPDHPKCLKDKRKMVDQARNMLLEAMAASKDGGENAFGKLLVESNNWQYLPSVFGKPEVALSTLTAGQGVVVFYGMAKPDKTPLIGPPLQPEASKR
jgi:hypothetical protein